MTDAQHYPQTLGDNTIIGPECITDGSTIVYKGVTYVAQPEPGEGNTHRAVIESSVPPMLTLIGAGPAQFCQEALDHWVSRHPLGEFETALILKAQP